MTTKLKFTQLCVSVIVFCSVFLCVQGKIIVLFLFISIYIFFSFCLYFFLIKIISHTFLGQQPFACGNNNSSRQVSPYTWWAFTPKGPCSCFQHNVAFYDNHQDALGQFSLYFDLCYLGGTPGISYVSFQEACSNVSQTIFSSADLLQYLVLALEDASQYSPLVLIMQVCAGFVQFSWGITFADSMESFAQSIPFSFFVPPWGNQIAYFDTSRPDITQNTSCGWLVNEMQETTIFWNQPTPQYIPSTINPLEMNQCTPVTPVPISTPFSAGMFASIVLSPSMSGSCPVNLNFTLTGSTGEQVLQHYSITNSTRNTASSYTRCRYLANSIGYAWHQFPEQLYYNNNVVCYGSVERCLLHGSWRCDTTNVIVVFIKQPSSNQLDLCWLATHSTLLFQHSRCDIF
jgi:hypothetical protein